MTSAFACQVLKVGAKCGRQSRQDQNRRVPPAAFNAAEIGLMHVGTVGEFLLREPMLASQRLQIEADSGPDIHRCMAGIELTSAHRL